jgi:hypothetical protein
MLFACERPFRIRIQPLFVNAVEIRGCANGTDKLSDLRIRPGLKAAASSLLACSHRRSRGGVRHPAGTAAATG